METFKRYSTENIHFLIEDETLSPTLIKGLKSISENSTILDLGCGEGRVLFTLHKNGLIHPNTKVIGVDLSPDRINRLARNLPFVTVIVSDALNVKAVSPGTVDLLICSQVIEHVDDNLLLLETRRLLAPKAKIFISTVLKKPYAVYIYFGKNGFKLDPTHIKEYPSVSAFTDLLKSHDLKVLEVHTKKVSFPVMDILLRVAIKLHIAKIRGDYYMRHRRLKKLRGLCFPVVGYSIIEVLAENSPKE
jgi:SAM-dependent methyltransferase